MNRSVTTYLCSLLPLTIVLTLSACSAEMMETILTPPAEDEATAPGQTTTPATTPATGPPRISYFRASPPHIMAGEQVELQWRTQDASAVEISGVGSVPNSGSRILDPDAGPGLYTLTARGESGAVVSQEIHISIVSPQMSGTGPGAVRLPESGVLQRVPGPLLRAPRSPLEIERETVRTSELPESVGGETVIRRNVSRP